MSVYRQIHTKIWSDAWFLDLLPEEKLLFIYLFSNDRAALCGLYELPLKIMGFETGLQTDAITLALGRFAKAGKAFYEAPHIWVTNLFKYNESKSPKVVTRVVSELASVPDCDLKRRYMAGVPDTVSGRTDTVSEKKRNPRKEQEKEQEQETEQEPIKPSRPSGRDKVRKALEEEFTGATKIPVPPLRTEKQKKSAGELWWAPLMEVAEMCGWDEVSGATLIRLAVERMRKDNLTIAWPKSILAVCRAMKAEGISKPMTDKQKLAGILDGTWRGSE